MAVWWRFTVSLFSSYYYYHSYFLSEQVNMSTLAAVSDADVDAVM